MTKMNQVIRIKSANTEKCQIKLTEFGNMWRVLYTDLNGNKPSLLAESLSPHIKADYMYWFPIDEIQYETVKS